MFTGIVEETGIVAAVEETDRGRRLLIRAQAVIDDIAVGASIAHNGVCLTVTRVEADGYWVDAVAETLDRSTLGRLWVDDRVNLERPVRASDRLGGHIVQGHVDGQATLTDRTREGESERLRFSLDPALLRYVVEKGSITLDGVSLTIAAVGDNWFEVAVIPHTAKATTLGSLRCGTCVNVEVDVMAKYVEKLVGSGARD